MTDSVHSTKSSGFSGPMAGTGQKQLNLKSSHHFLCSVMVLSSVLLDCQDLPVPTGLHAVSSGIASHSIWSFKQERGFLLWTDWPGLAWTSQVGLPSSLPPSSQRPTLCSVLGGFCPRPMFTELLWPVIVGSALTQLFPAMPAAPCPYASISFWHERSQN